MQQVNIKKTLKLLLIENETIISKIVRELRYNVEDLR